MHRSQIRSWSLYSRWSDPGFRAGLISPSSSYTRSVRALSPTCCAATPI